MSTVFPDSPLLAGAGGIACSTGIISAALITASGGPRMLAVELNEANAIAQATLTALLASAGPQPGEPGAKMRLTIGQLSVAAPDDIAAGTFAAPFLAAFEAVRAAGATYQSMDRVRVLAASYSPVYPTGIYVADLAVRLALTEQALMLAATTFANRQQIDAAIDVVNAAFSTAEDEAADELDNVSYRALITLHAAVVNDLSTRARPLPRMIKYVFAESNPALWLAQRIYGDGSRAPELIAENAPIHPLFVKSNVIGLSQ